MEEEEALHAGVVKLSLAHDAENLMLLAGGTLDLEGAGAKLEVVGCSRRSGPALDRRRGLGDVRRERGEDVRRARVGEHELECPSSAALTGTYDACLNTPRCWKVPDAHERVLTDEHHEHAKVGGLGDSQKQIALGLRFDPSLDVSTLAGRRYTLELLPDLCQAHSTTHLLLPVGVRNDVLDLLLVFALREAHGKAHDRRRVINPGRARIQRVQEHESVPARSGLANHAPAGNFGGFSPGRPPKVCPSWLLGPAEGLLVLWVGQVQGLIARADESPDGVPLLEL